MFVPNIKETQEDNYDTYNNLSDVPLKKAIEDRLYFIRSEKKYYRYDGTLKQLVIAIDLSSINANIQQIAQDVASISSDYATKSYVDEKIVPDDPLSPNFFTLSYPTGASTVPSMSLYSSTESRIDGVVNVNNIQNMRMNNMDTLNNEQNGRLLNIEDANVIQNGRLDTLEANQGGINGRLDSHDSTFVTTINRLSAVEGINSTQTSNISTLLSLPFV